MFGIFARNFKLFKEQQFGNEKENEVFKKAFKQSQILDDMQSKDLKKGLMNL